MIPFNTAEQRYQTHPLHEFYADEFACALLMPIEDVLICLTERRTVHEMAERWGVPVGAVIAWLRRLAAQPPEDCTEADLKNLALWRKDPTPPKERPMTATSTSTAPDLDRLRRRALDARSVSGGETLAISADSALALLDLLQTATAERDRADRTLSHLDEQLEAVRTLLHRKESGHRMRRGSTVRISEVRAAMGEPR